MKRSFLVTSYTLLDDNVSLFCFFIIKKITNVITEPDDLSKDVITKKLKLVAITLLVTFGVKDKMASI